MQEDKGRPTRQEISCGSTKGLVTVQVVEQRLPRMREGQALTEHTSVSRNARWSVFQHLWYLQYP